MSRPGLYVVDGSSYVYRAYHAIRPLSTSTGIPTNAVYGFTTMLLKLLRERRPDYLAVAFDARKPTFRKEMYADYKANRSAPPDDLALQFPLVRELVRAFNLPLLEVEGFEADDVIATVARRARELGCDVWIVSSDKDLMQVVDERVRLFDTLKDKEIGPAEVVERFGVEPARVVEVLGLAGDASDNIPGVPGIGEKTAARLIQQYGTIDEVLRHIDEIPGEKRRESLKTYGEQARLSRRLATVRDDAPVEVDLAALAPREPDRAALSALLARLEFRTLLADLALEAPAPAAATATTAVNPDRYFTVTDARALADVVERCRRSGGFALAADGTSPNPMRAALAGVALAWGPGEACYVPVDHRYLGARSQLSRAQLLDALGPLLADPSVPKYGQNTKYDYIVLCRAGVAIEGIGMDTQVAAYLLDPSRPSYRLDELAREYLGHVLTEGQGADRGKRERAPDEVDVATATRSCAERADVAYRLSGLLAARLREAGMEALLRDVELPLVRVLALMEMRGVRVDTAVLSELSKRFDEMARRSERRIYELAGVEFNPNSPKQLQEILFGKLGLKPLKRTQTGFSTDVDVLEALAREHPLPAEILEYRSVAKLKSTYVDTLPALIHPETGRIHTSYNQAVAATGRLSSSDPNLQNIPVRTELGREIRRAFVAEAGHRFASADYSQIELRILAHVSGDPTLCDAFRRGDDIHARTAAEVFGLDPRDVTEEIRTSAKAINFGILYGMGAFRLSRQLGISTRQAQAYIDDYFRRLPGVKRYIEQTLEAARRDGYVRTLLGRRRFLPDIASRNHNLRSAAERIAVNTPIQGSAADLIKMAMVRIQRAIDERRLGARMILQVHDELVFEVPEAELDEVTALARERMETVADLQVPLKVDLSVGTHWAETHA